MHSSQLIKTSSTFSVTTQIEIINKLSKNIIQQLETKIGIKVTISIQTSLIE